MNDLKDDTVALQDVADVAIRFYDWMQTDAAADVIHDKKLVGESIDTASLFDEWLKTIC